MDRPRQARPNRVMLPMSMLDRVEEDIAAFRNV